jgi:hypothetical protein
MKLDVKGFALASGILWAAVVFLATLQAHWRGLGHHLYLLAALYWGYQVSYLGSIIGLVYGFVSGLLGGALLAWLYNRLAKAA